MNSGSPFVATECLAECYYDGGISRINLFGKAVDPAPERKNLLEGAAISHVANEHYGKPGRAVTGNQLARCTLRRGVSAALARATGLKRRGAVADLSVTHYIHGGLNPERGDLHHANPPSKNPTHRHARPVHNL